MRHPSANGLPLAILFTVFSLTVTHSTGPSFAQVEQADTVLESGKAVQKELDAKAVHSYEITLGAGQFVRALVDQRGINVFVTIYAPDGTKLAELDGPLGAQGPEPVSIVADKPGRYRLEIRALQQTSPAGRYEIRVEELRTATADDRTRVSAERAFAAATFLGGRGTAESVRKAIAGFRATIPLWQALGDRRQEAFTLTAIGYAHRILAEYQQALECYSAALSLSRAVGDAQGEATTLSNIGLIRGNLGEHQRALDFYSQALAMHRVAGNRSMEAVTLANIGSAHSALGNLQKALDSYNEALVITRERGNPPVEATLLNNIGLAHRNSGESQKALEILNDSLALTRAILDRGGEAITLNNIGKVYEDLGELDTALGFYRQVVDIKRSTGNRAEEAIALTNVGLVRNAMGDRREALDSYQQALTISRATGARSTEAAALGAIGVIYQNSGDHKNAIDFHEQALSIQRDIGERRREAATLSNIGRSYYARRDVEKALQLFDQALALRRSVGDRGGEAVTLYNIALAQRDLGRLVEARAHTASALTIVESLRSKVASQELRTSYLASVQRYYELGIDVLMRLHQQQPSAGFDAAALTTSESARARSLLELLVEARTDIREGVSSTLIEAERSLQQQLDAKAAAQTRLLSGTHTAEQAAAAAREIDGLTREYEAIKGRIRQQSPRYAALTQPAPLSLHEIQTAVLDDQTLLLEYSLGEEQSFLWAVTTSSIATHRLPGRAEIESAARRFYDVLNARNQFPPGETSARRQIRVDRADWELPAASAALGRMLLGPVVSHLQSRRLVVVSDGILQYIPFAALSLPETAKTGTSAAYRPLVANHEIVSLPSASVLAVLRQESSHRMPAPKLAAVLADPVFYGDDPRVKGRGVRLSSRAQPAAELKRSATESGLDDFTRLRFSRREAEQIARLAPSGERLIALDFAASRAAATSPDLGEYAIVHFATHGLINSRHPELSGIVLSLVDENGKPQNGFLRLHEIYNSRLHAELVVLSACQTALGKDVRGEGLVGLTRGFMYAGAPRVLATLWQIDDQATAELMRRFYEAKLKERLPAAAALRTAQIAMWKDKRWGSPHYWAGFTLQGEWK